jgi:hypothetical protein
MHLRLLCTCLTVTVFAACSSTSIIVDANAGPFTVLAQREMHRYLLATGLAATVSQITIAELNSTTSCLPHAEASALRNKETGYSIVQSKGHTCVTGFDDLNALYGVYSLLELIGIYFSSTNPVIPASLRPWPAEGFSVVASPAFTTRGLQPFHGTLLLLLRRRYYAERAS